MQQLELLSSQLDAAAASEYLSATEVHHDIHNLQLGILLLCSVLLPPQQRAHPREKLLQCEGLDQIVIRAKIQPLHAIDYLIPCCQHHNRHGHSALSHAPHNLPAVQLGHHHIHQNQS